MDFGDQQENERAPYRKAAKLNCCIFDFSSERCSRISLAAGAESHRLQRFIENSSTTASRQLVFFSNIMQKEVFLEQASLDLEKRLWSHLTGECCQSLLLGRLEMTDLLSIFVGSDLSDKRFEKRRLVQLEVKPLDPIIELLGAEI